MLGHGPNLARAVVRETSKQRKTTADCAAGAASQMLFPRERVVEQTGEWGNLYKHPCGPKARLTQGHHSALLLQGNHLKAVPAGNCASLDSDLVFELGRLLVPGSLTQGCAEQWEDFECHEQDRKSNHMGYCQKDGLARGLTDGMAYHQSE